MRVNVGQFFYRFKTFLLASLAFLTGASGAKDYFYLLNIGQASKIITIFIILIFFIVFLVFPGRFLMWKRRRHLLVWIEVAFFVVFIKYLSLFLFSPQDFFGDVNAGVVSAPDYSTKPEYLFETYFFLIIFLSMTFFICAVENMKQLRTSIFFLAVGSAVAPLIGFIYFPYMIGSREISVNGQLLAGGFWNPSVIAFVTVFWLALAIMKEIPFFSAWILRILLISTILGALVGLSRSVYVSIFCSMLIFFVLSKNVKAKFFFIVFLVLGAIVFVYFFWGVVEHIQSRFAQHGNLSNESRLLAWQQYLSHIEDYWLTGALPQGFRFYSSEGYGPHSIFLNWFVRGGIFGLMSFLWLLYGVLRSIRDIGRFYSREKGYFLMAWMMAYLAFVSYNETGFIVPSFYVVFALILVLAELVKTNSLE